MAQTFEYEVMMFYSSNNLSLLRPLTNVMVSLIAALVVLCMLGSSESASAAENSAKGGLTGATKSIDLRQRRLNWRDEIKEQNLEPIFNEAALEKQMSELLRPLDSETFSVQMPFGKPLSYHLVIRFDADKSASGYLEFHIPQSANALSKPPEPAAIFIDRIDAALKKLVASGDILLVDEAGKADVFINISMTDRAQSSSGFSYEGMSKLSTRHPEYASEGMIVTESVLPFAIVRAYLLRGPAADVRKVIGGEIWIEYSKRTYWQAAVAQIALDDPTFSRKMGLGGTRREIISAYRRPLALPLQELEEAVSGTVANTSKPRPGENLLSVAEASQQTKEGGLGQIECPSCRIRCGESEHAGVIASRLLRAISMFARGIRAGAVPVGQQGSYAQDFAQNPGGFLADASLDGYQGVFDQRLDDAIAIHVMPVLRDFVIADDQNLQLRFGFQDSPKIWQRIKATIRQDTTLIAQSLAADTICPSRSTMEMSKQ